MTDDEDILPAIQSRLHPFCVELADALVNLGNRFAGRRCVARRVEHLFEVSVANREPEQNIIKICKNAKGAFGEPMINLEIGSGGTKCLAFFQSNMAGLLSP